MATFDARATAAALAAAHRSREPYRELAAALAPQTVADAYAAQEALREFWEPLYGPVAGLKIATTTKVMQQLMGIDHPCGGMIYARRIHNSPHMLSLKEHMHVVVECELAVRLARSLPPQSTPYTREDVRPAVDTVMAAFELIEDRNADYKATRALTLIADNAWNAGIVLGAAISPPATLDLDGLKGRLSTGEDVREGRTDDPMGALAWLANLANDRQRPLFEGQVVITGSLIATLPIQSGQTFSFEIENVGRVEMTAAA